jgi:hypothetical protein
LQYSVGFTGTAGVVGAVGMVPARAWTPAYDSDGGVRDGAWIAELTGLLDLAGPPTGIRVIARKERPHPGAQLRFTDVDGHRITCFATSAKTGQLADLELRHRQRARCQDRIRNAKDTGLRNLPLHGYGQNQIWCQIVALACDLPAWTQLLALTATARRWEPKRLRLFSAAGRITRGARRLRLRLAAAPWPWATQITTAISRLQAMAPANPAPLPLRTGRRNPRAHGTPPTRRDSQATSHGEPRNGRPAAASAQHSKIKKNQDNEREATTWLT